MHFSYAFLDCERIRGISADLLRLDECLHKDIDILTPTGYHKLHDCKPGDQIMGFDTEDKIRTDRIIDIVPKGRRPVWKVTLENGAIIECTDNEKLRTEQGWMYLQEILDDRDIPEIRVCTAPVLPQGRSAKQHPMALTSSSIVKLEYIGEHEVFDIETEKHHTLFAGGVAVHNCQDIDPDFIPIIAETLSASNWDLRQFTGTPKTLDNTLQELWEKSSQGEWGIPCDCKLPNRFWNIASITEQLSSMIQQDGLSCANCGKLLDATTGRWVHGFEDKLATFPGIHVPQPIMPMHYAAIRS
jgi:hypothetical protein